MLSDSNSRMFRKKGKLKKIVAILTIVIMTAVLGGCNSLDDAVAKAKPLIPKGYDLVTVEQVSDNSGIVFYTFEEELSTGIFTKNSFGWKWTGSAVGKLVTYPDGLQWRYADLGEDGTQYSVYYGKITNKDIVRVTVTTIGGEKVQGKIVNTDQLRLWYAFVSEPQVPSVSADITGYSAEGKVIYLFSQPKQ
ncbi:MULTISPECIES: hypothetical protein [unclassified Dehalobacter]|uniref:hypothetical protein n=1 Tax=unclassified Dehalobacter TaxID=2635733 RepID=UPI001FA7AA1C|nr:MULTISPECIES: hypothetical protein [unclassified Dehalobacter]